jgi:hypothetical protein
MPTIDIPDIWSPTQENIRALPLALRKYILWLQKTAANPDGVYAENHWMLETNAAYQQEIERLKALLREAGIDPGKKV